VSGTDSITDEYGQAIAELARLPAIGEGNLSAAFSAITERAATVLSAARASIWLFRDESRALECIDLYELASDRHSAAAELISARYPNYVAALNQSRVIRANDAMTDPATSDFAADYLPAHGIGAMLDAPIRAKSKVAGVLCIEHVGGSRNWSAEEARLAGSLSDFATLALVSHERARAETALLQAQKLEALGRLAGGIAHDFNNLLTVINGGVDTIIANNDAGPESSKLLTLVADAGDRAIGLTRQLLAFSRRQILNIQPLSIKELVLRVEGFAERIIREDIELRVDLLGPDRTVACDPTQIEQVLMNLVVNASDAMPGGGELAITVNTRDEACAEIIVADTGNGMSPAVVDHIFEPFFTTKSDAGTGLGLSVSLGIIEQHGGRIRVESQQGAGSQFTVELPATSEEAVEDPPSRVRAPAVTGPIKILVAEDEVDVRRVLELFLERQGYHPFLARDAQHALSLLDSHHFDLLISDVIMPDMKGPELYAEALLRQPDLKVLFVSGYTEDVLSKLQQNGVDYQYLPKPFSIAQLTSAIGSIVS